MQLRDRQTTHNVSICVSQIYGMHMIDYMSVLRNGIKLEIILFVLVTTGELFCVEQNCAMEIEACEKNTDCLGLLEQAEAGNNPGAANNSQWMMIGQCFVKNNCENATVQGRVVNRKCEVVVGNSLSIS